MRKILVTGGKGFIGSKIVERLCNDHQVTVFDNSDGYGILDKEELKNLYKWRERNWKNVYVLSGDVTDRMDCLKAFSNRPDVVIHLAAYPRAKIVNDDPCTGVPKIINGTTNLLWHSLKFEVKKFVYISSSMVYGDFKDGTSEGSSTKPKNIYGEAKLAGERLTKLFNTQNNLNYVICRPSGVYGPGDMPDRVVSKFFDKAMNNNDITLHNGSNKVDFTYVDDAVDGIIRSALSSVANISFNITAGNATSLQTLADEIIKITNSESEINDIGNHELYPMRGTLDISRAKSLLDYEPKTTLQEGLKKYYEWLRQYTNKI
jgi:nucleoside-diphosphate-sugar epimerase